MQSPDKQKATSKPKKKLSRADRQDALLERLVVAQEGQLAVYTRLERMYSDAMVVIQKAVAKATKA